MKTLYIERLNWFEQDSSAFSADESTEKEYWCGGYVKASFQITETLLFCVCGKFRPSEEEGRCLVLFEDLILISELCIDLCFMLIQTLKERVLINSGL